jgi:hypothetical protein
MFRSLLLGVLSVFAVSAPAWAQSPALAASEPTRVCVATANGQSQPVRLDLPAQERMPALLDAREPAPVPHAAKHRWFWDAPTWQPLTW